MSIELRVFMGFLSSLCKSNDLKNGLIWQTRETKQANETEANKKRVRLWEKGMIIALKA